MIKNKFDHFLIKHLFLILNSPVSLSPYPSGKFGLSKCRHSSLYSVPLLRVKKKNENGPGGFFESTRFDLSEAEKRVNS